MSKGDYWYCGLTWLFLLALMVRKVFLTSSWSARLSFFRFG